MTVSRLGGEGRNCRPGRNSAWFSVSLLSCLLTPELLPSKSDVRRPDLNRLCELVSAREKCLKHHSQEVPELGLKAKTVDKSSPSTEQETRSELLPFISK